MNKKELLEIVKKEAKKLDGKVYAHFVAKPGTQKTGHAELRIIEGNKLANRGFILYRKDGKIHNGELFDSVIERILSNIYEIKEASHKGDKINFLSIKNKKLSYKKYNFVFEIKPFSKKLKFYINNVIIFTLRKIKKENGKYLISQKSIEKSYEILERELIFRFKTTIEDFNLCKSLIEPIVNYLMVE